MEIRELPSYQQTFLKKLKTRGAAPVTLKKYLYFFKFFDLKVAWVF